MEVSCKICGNKTNNTWYDVKEMMLGTGDSFRYFQCNACNCLQLENPPVNMARYYPEDYYSFNTSPELYFKNIFKSYIQGMRHAYLLTGKGLAGKWLAQLLPNRFPELANFRYAGLKKTDKILDVGSGNGVIPYIFKNAGFRYITGIDPYLSKDIRYSNGLEILKKYLFEVEEKGWDKLMFNHSFEHLEEPGDYLEKANQLLSPHGSCIIRIPIVSSEAWEIYRENWVQLDAPRHYFLYSLKSMGLLAEQHGFKVSGIYFESTAFQFIGSEQYLRGISLYGNALSYYKGNRSIFTDEEVNAFQLRAEQLNKEKKGDMVSLVLQKL